MQDQINSSILKNLQLKEGLLSDTQTSEYSLSHCSSQQESQYSDYSDENAKKGATSGIQEQKAVYAVEQAEMAQQMRRGTVDLEAIKMKQMLTKVKGLSQLADNKAKVDDLIVKTNINTSHDGEIDYLMIANGSKYCLCIIKLDEFTNEVHSYSLTTYKQYFKRRFQGEYIKMDIIEQTLDGSKFVIAYQDNGTFFVDVIDYRGNKIDLVRVSKILKIDTKSLPISGFCQPLITACFIDNRQIYINTYHRFQKKQYHFLYDIVDKCLLGDIVVVNIDDCTPSNFPLRSILNTSTNEVFNLYRQGNMTRVPLKDTSTFDLTKLNGDVDSVFFIYNKVIIVRSSSNVLFIKQNHGRCKSKLRFDQAEQEVVWEEYYRLEKMRGQIFCQTQQDQEIMQVTTENYIYFYVIDPQTLMPKLDSVLINFMGCSQIMFGKRVRYAIAYKASAPNFQIYARRQFHNYKVAISEENYEGAQGCNLNSIKAFVIAFQDNIQFFDQGTFKQFQFLKIPKVDETECNSVEVHSNEVLYICCSSDETHIGVTFGSKLPNDNFHVQKIIIIERNMRNKYQIAHQLMWDQNILEKVCIQFYFNIKNNSELIFFGKDSIFKINLKKGKRMIPSVIHKIKNKFDTHPKFCQFNKSQDTCIIATNTDALHINLKTKEEVDLDEDCAIGSIQNCSCDDVNFYLMANKKDKLLGYYFVRIGVKDPINSQGFLIQWNNKLDIRDCDVSMFYETLECGNKHNYVVLSFKSIGINTYNVVVLDLLTGKPKYWHESFQLWESPVKGFLLTSNYFMILSKSGINLLSIGYKGSRQVLDKDGFPRYIHALGSCNYLKVDPSNVIFFSCQFYDDRQIWVEEQYDDAQTQETKFEFIYKIKIAEISLRELLMVDSIYNCKTISNISDLVQMQPTPLFFFKTFLELDKKCMIQQISFDSKSIEYLLCEDNKQYFDKEFPIFFKNEDGSSAIDLAMKYNQLQSVNLMIKYMIKFQNEFVYAHLFKDNLLELIRMGAVMRDLLESNILSHQISYTEWPDNSTDTQRIMAPYNGDLFQIRQSYKAVFSHLAMEEEEQKINEMLGEMEFRSAGESSATIRSQRASRKEKLEGKRFKIEYHLNILPNITEKMDVGVSMMQALEDSDELLIFETGIVQDIIDYKWIAYAFRIHMLAAIVHACYLFVLMYYINQTYLLQNGEYILNEDTDEEEQQASIFCLIIQGICLVVPLVYESYQVKMLGFGLYFTDLSNYLDIMHILFGFINIYFQLFMGIMNILTKVIIIVEIILSLAKTFVFMRIVLGFSYIVTMIVNVIIDMNVFFLYFFIQVMFFSNTFAIVCKHDYGAYRKLNPVMGNFIFGLRLSLGDHEFSTFNNPEMTASDKQIFWMIWVGMIFFTALIFLTFVIARVSDSYYTVNSQIQPIIYKERCVMINQTEKMLPKIWKANMNKFPKYIISRNVET